MRKSELFSCCPVVWYPVLVICLVCLLGLALKSCHLQLSLARYCADILLVLNSESECTHCTPHNFMCSAQVTAVKQRERWLTNGLVSSIPIMATAFKFIIF